MGVHLLVPDLCAFWRSNTFTSIAPAAIKGASLRRQKIVPMGAAGRLSERQTARAGGLRLESGERGWRVEGRGWRVGRKWGEGVRVGAGEVVGSIGSEGWVGYKQVEEMKTNQIRLH